LCQRGGQRQQERDHDDHFKHRSNEVLNIKRNRRRQKKTAAAERRRRGRRKVEPVFFCRVTVTVIKPIK
jgi:hypothetical protein